MIPIKLEISARSILIAVLLVPLTSLLALQLVMLFSNDTGLILRDYYSYFVPWGQAARLGHYNYRYPLATLIWVFVPLSALPDWFAIFWFAVPFASIIYIFRRKGLVLWLFWPVLLQANSGQLDGWLLMPLYWVCNERPLLSELSCALLTLKPQLAFLVVPFTLWQWFARRKWKSLLTFATAFAVLYIPAFFLDPVWPLEMVPELVTRSGESILPSRGVSLWWWRTDNPWATSALFLFIGLVAVLFVRAFRQIDLQRKAVYLLGLLVMPVLYAVSYITVIPTLANNRRHLLAITLVSWTALFLDIVFHGWGGAYVLIPVAVLWLIAQNTPDEAHIGIVPQRTRQPLAGG